MRGSLSPEPNIQFKALVCQNALPQPLLRISVSINPEDYKQFGLNSPEVSQSFTDSIAGASIAV